MLIRELLTISVYPLSPASWTPGVDRGLPQPRSGQESSISSSPSGTPVALLCPVVREAELGGCVLAGMCERERECVSMCVGGACACQ